MPRPWFPDLPLAAAPRDRAGHRAGPRDHHARERHQLAAARRRQSRHRAHHLQSSVGCDARADHGHAYEFANDRGGYGWGGRRGSRPPRAASPPAAPPPRPPWDLAPAPAVACPPPPGFYPPPPPNPRDSSPP